MSNVLILSLFFPPDNVSTAHIMGELASDLLQSGHQVRVITATPHYNRDPIAEERQKLTKTGVPFLRKSTYEGIAVLHVRMPRKEKSVVRRLMSWSAFHVMTTLTALFTGPKPDVIICPSPPLTIGISAWIIAKRWKARFVYNVQEIYPDIAINLGALRSKLLIAVARAIERFVYRKASAITVIAPRMQQRLLERGVPPQKLKVIPNFVDVSGLHPLPKDNEFAREYGLSDKFVVNYSGNVGPAQGLESLLRAAELLRDDPRVHFVFTGDGTLYQDLQAIAVRERLANVTLLKYQPFTRMSAIYSSADVCVVPQAPATGFDAVPSKVYRIMACARAVLAVTDPASDLAQLIRDARCGITTPAGDPAAIAAALRIGVEPAERVRWGEMGRNGYEYVRQHNKREAVTAQYDQVVRQLSAG